VRDVVFLSGDESEDTRFDSYLSAVQHLAVDVRASSEADRLHTLGLKTLDMILHAQCRICEIAGSAPHGAENVPRSVNEIRDKWMMTMIYPGGRFAVKVVKAV